MRFVRAAELIGMPVVSLERATIVGEVRDVLFDPLRWRFLGFTLRGRGLLSAPMIGMLQPRDIRALGRDAVMIASDDVLLREAEDVKSALGEHEDAVGHEVVTDGGETLGKVADLVLETDRHRTTVVGYSIRRDDGHELMVPLLPETGPNWGEAMVVPSGVESVAAEGLIGFRQALARTRDSGQPRAEAAS